jgi:SAM-dependent methyltransferase
MPNELHEQNRKSWNHATRAHETHKAGQAAFLREGGTTLFPEEIALLGDVRGKRVVHLQCNAGPDTLSIATLGAQVTGVDISDTAIEAARRLSEASGIAGMFVRSDLFDWFRTAPDPFDVAFASYGALCWISDLPGWARGVASVLAPGGRLIVMEFHPALYVIEWVDGRWVFGPTRGGGGARIDWPTGISDYVGASGDGLVPWGAALPGSTFANPEQCHEFEWSIGDVVAAIADAGLRVATLREWHYSNGCRFWPPMVDVGDRRWGLPPEAPRMPLMYGLVASR